MEKATTNSGLTAEEVKVYVGDVGSTGQLLADVGKALANLIPAMWNDELRERSVLEHTSEALASLREAETNLEILDGYLRDLIKAKMKGKERTLMDARGDTLHKIAEDVVGDLEFDDAVKATYTTTSFPEGSSPSERRAWKTEQLQGFKLLLDDFAVKVEKKGSDGTNQD